jgi:hypothetical protein
MMVSYYIPGANQGDKLTFRAVQIHGDITVSSTDGYQTDDCRDADSKMRSARRRARHMSFSLLSWWGGVKCLDDELCVKRGVCLLECALYAQKRL